MRTRTDPDIKTVVDDPAVLREFGPDVQQSMQTAVSLGNSPWKAGAEFIHRTDAATKDQIYAVKLRAFNAFYKRNAA